MRRKEIIQAGLQNKDSRVNDANISGRRIENQSALKYYPKDLSTDCISPPSSLARVVFAIKPRAKSIGNNAKIVRSSKKKLTRCNNPRKESINKSFVNYSSISLSKSKLNNKPKSTQKHNISFKGKPRIKLKIGRESTKHVDTLIKDNLRKLFHMKQKQMIKQKQREEKIKREKEELMEKNNEIRKMNAKNVNYLNDQGIEHKCAWGVDQRKLKSAQTKREIDSSLSQRHNILSNRESILELMKKFSSKGKENLVENKKAPHSKTFRTNIEINKKAIEDFIKRVGDKESNLFVRRRNSEKVKKKPIEINKRNSVVMIKQSAESNAKNSAISKIIRRELLKEVGMNVSEEKPYSAKDKLKESIETLAKLCIQKANIKSSRSKSERYQKLKLQLQKANQEVQTDNILTHKDRYEDSDDEGILREEFMVEIKSVEKQIEEIKLIEPQRNELIEYIENIKDTSRPLFEASNITDNLLEDNPKPNSNNFHEFTLKQFKDLMKEENLSKIITIREKLLHYREKTEKKYLNHLYKYKKYSPRTYQRKKVELEKWVTREKVEIKKSKRLFMENWKQTADMIEETHQNAVRVKQMVFEGTWNDLGNTHFGLSGVLNTSRNLIEEIKLSHPKKNNFYDLDSLLNESSEGIVIPLSNEAILIKEHDNKIEDTLLVNKAPIKKPPTQPDHRIKKCLEEDKSIIGKESVEHNKSVVHKNSSELRIAKVFSENIIPKPHTAQLPNKEENIDLNVVNKSIAKEEEHIEVDCKPAWIKGESFPSLQQTETQEKKKPTLTLSSEFPVSTTKPNYLKQALEYGMHNNIDTSPDYIDELLELAFSSVIGRNRNIFLLQINTSLAKDLESILEKLQRNGPAIEVMCHFSGIPIINEQICTRVSQVLALKKPSNESIRKNQGVYNKAILDATNEALNMLRPYGLSGEPLPWSNQQRILFKEITDTDLIVKNVKSMVYSFI